MIDTDYPLVEYHTGEDWMGSPQIRQIEIGGAGRQESKGRSADPARQASASPRRWSVTVLLNITNAQPAQDHFESKPGRWFRFPLRGNEQVLDKATRDALPVVQYESAPVVRRRSPQYVQLSAVVVEVHATLGAW